MVQGHSPIIFLGFPRPSSHGLFAKWALQWIRRLVLKIAIFAHGVLTWQCDGLHPQVLTNLTVIVADFRSFGTRHNFLGIISFFWKIGGRNIANHNRIK